MAPRILKFGERHIKHRPKQMERERRENEGVRGEGGRKLWGRRRREGPNFAFLPFSCSLLRSVLHTAAELILPSVVVLPISPSSLYSLSLSPPMGAGGGVLPLRTAKQQ